jgi:ABC-type branched-subunit amino acid transport system substrate-binding protein
MLDRRTFLSALAGGALPALARRRRAAGAAPRLRVGLVRPGAAHDPDHEHGATFGLEEIRRAADLLGGAVDAVRDPTSLAGLAAVVGGHDDPSARRLAEAAARAGVVFVNVGAGDAALRDAGRWPTTFHVALPASHEPAGALLWHPSLSRYGAAQLNERYRRRFARPMTGPAWAGWMALKLLWEAALRADGGDGAALARRLASPDARFDGHKGRPLAFDARTHQLVQSVYVADRSAGDAQVREVAP